MVPGTADSLPHAKAFLQRPLIMGAIRAHSDDVSIDPRQKDASLADVA